MGWPSFYEDIDGMRIHAVELEKRLKAINGASGQNSLHSAEIYCKNLIRLFEKILSDDYLKKLKKTNAKLERNCRNLERTSLTLSNVRDELNRKISMLTSENHILQSRVIQMEKDHAALIRGLGISRRTIR